MSSVEERLTIANDALNREPTRSVVDLETWSKLTEEGTMAQICKHVASDSEFQNKKGIFILLACLFGFTKGVR